MSCLWRLLSIQRCPYSEVCTSYVHMLDKRKGRKGGREGEREERSERGRKGGREREGARERTCYNVYTFILQFELVHF